MNPFGDFHNRHHRFGNSHPSSSSRRDPHRQQMALFDQMFSPMRMSVFNHDPFGHDFGGHHAGMISSFNISFGFVYLSFFFLSLIEFFFICSGGNSRPVAKKTTKSTKIINGRRVVTTR